MRGFCQITLLIFMLALPCLADDFCPLLHQPQATYALPPKTAKDILTTLSKTAKFNPDSFPLHEDRDKYLKKRGTGRPKVRRVSVHLLQSGFHRGYSEQERQLLAQIFRGRP